VLPWLFLIFRDKWNGVRVILQTYSWKPVHIGNMGTILHMVTRCAANFGLLTIQIFHCDFKCKTNLAKYDHRYLTCEVFLHHDLMWRNTDLAGAGLFLRANKKSPLKTPFCWYSAYNLYDMYVPLQSHNFVAKAIYKLQWTCGSKKYMWK